MDMDSLHFMFVRHANLLGEISIAKDQFQSVIELINERSRFMREEIQPKLKAANVPQEFNIEIGRLNQILGPGNLQEAVNLANQLVESLDRIELQVLEVTNRFGAALSSYFPSIRLSISLMEITDGAKQNADGPAAA
ncbi:hypothetical protein CSC74_09600 [Pseudoxanthomonas yeongjuensis]|nr:hypothetical protein CSC74_09600 [Pseudoxanthomonas yeongjuensis]